LAEVAGSRRFMKHSRWFERNPVYGDKYKVVEDPLYSRLGSSVLTYVGFHLGNGNFSQDSRCAGPIASSGLISQKWAYFFVKFNPLNGNEAFKPHKFKIRFVGLCGVESPATVKILERNGQDTLREMGTFAIGTDFETAGTTTIQAHTYSSEIAIQLTSGVDPNGDNDDFLVGSMEIEALDQDGPSGQKVDLRAEAATWKFQGFKDTNFQNKVYGFEWGMEMQSSVFYDGPGSPGMSWLQTAKSLMVTNSRIMACDVKGMCFYTNSGAIPDVSKVGLSTLQRVTVCQSDYLCYKNIKLSQMLPGSEEVSKAVNDHKFNSKKLTVIEAETQLVLASLGYEFRKRYGRDMTKDEILGLIARISKGVSDENTIDDLMNAAIAGRPLPSSVSTFPNLDRMTGILLPSYYIERYPDLKNTLGYDLDALIKHYNRNGIVEGRSPSPAFDPIFYLNRYPNLKSIFGDNWEKAARHWISSGLKECRIGSENFNPESYMNRYPDLKAEFGNDCTAAYEHYLNHGYREGRDAR
jgi:hypothetical protein